MKALIILPVLFLILILWTRKSKKKQVKKKEEDEEMIEFLQSLSPDQLEMLSGNVKADQVDRKERSIEFCKDHSIPYIDHLPFYNSETETTIQSKEAIVQRALALAYVALKSEGLDEESLQPFNTKFGAKEFLSDQERQYVEANTPTDQQTANANWRYESLHVLLWALGYIDTLSYPSEMCNPEELIKIIVTSDVASLQDNAQPRTVAEILDKADLMYRIHWACTNARIKGEPMPSSLNGSVVYERRYALNWLIRLDDEDWDQVPMDT